MTQFDNTAGQLKQLSAEIAWGVGRIQAQAGVLAVCVGVALGWDERDIMKTRIIAELTLVDTAGALMTDHGRELYRQVEHEWCGEITTEQRQIGLACVQLLLNLPVTWPENQTVCELLKTNYDVLG